jgi:hypothetical protein
LIPPRLGDREVVTLSYLLSNATHKRRQNAVTTYFPVYPLLGNLLHSTPEQACTALSPADQSDHQVNNSGDHSRYSPLPVQSVLVFIDSDAYLGMIMCGVIASNFPTSMCSAHLLSAFHALPHLSSACWKWMFITLAYLVLHDRRKTIQNR